MQLALETEILYELSLAIGDSPELSPMLRRFLSELLRLLNGSGAAVLRPADAGEAATSEDDAIVASMLPRPLDGRPAMQAFRSRWALPALLAELQARGGDRPLVEAHAGETVHAFLLPGFGVLLLLRPVGPLSEHLQRAFAPLARKLAQSARACRVEDELRRQSWRLSLATEAAGIGVWEYDVRSGRLTWDTQMHTVFDIPPDRFGGRFEDFAKAVHPDDAERVAREFGAALAHDDQFELEFRIRRGDGSTRHLYGAGRVQRDLAGAPELVVGVNFDVTARREAEEAMRAARDLAEAANVAKSDFIANMSHELRTPMNGIIGMTELALETELSDAQRAYLRVVRSSADGLLAILNDILDFSKIDAGELQLEAIPFSLGVTVAETLKAMSVRAERKHLELVLDLPDDLPALSVGDPGRLRQVLVNLCDNAIKFTHRGEVIVRVQSTPVDANTDAIALTVRDTGIGIERAQQERVFEAFQQVDASVTREYGGTGLGLSITRQLITRMGGSIALESAPGEGTTFTVHLVLPRAPETIASVPPLRRFEGHVALVVDDHPLGRETVGRLLAHWGFAVHYAADGEQALALARDPGLALDLFVVDGVMPRLDGFGFAEALRDHDPTAMRRVVLLSSGGRKGDAARCRALGIRGFLTKPATPAELRELVTRVLGDVRTPAFGSALITRHSMQEQPRPLHVLLVEDNPVNQAVVKGMLASLGHDVTIAGDGEAALAATREGTFDLILMDLQMPRLDGMEATRRLRARDAGRPRVPVIALTANAMASAREECLAAGMDDHLAKPVRLAQLRAALARVGAGLGRSLDPADVGVVTSERD